MNVMSNDLSAELIDQVKTKFNDLDDSQKALFNFLCNFINFEGKISFSKELLNYFREAQSENIQKENEKNVVDINNDIETSNNSEDRSRKLNNFKMGDDVIINENNMNPEIANVKPNSFKNFDTEEDQKIFDSAEIKNYLNYGQVLLSVYRLVKRGIVPDPRIVEYLENSIDTELAKQLVNEQLENHKNSTILPLNGEPKVWTRATLVDLVLGDEQKYGCIASIPEEAKNDIQYAVKLEGLTSLQQCLYKRYLKTSLRTPEQAYNYIVNTQNSISLTPTKLDINGNHDLKSSILAKLDCLLRVDVCKIHTYVQGNGMNELNNKNVYRNVPSLFMTINRFRKNNFCHKKLSSVCLFRIKDELLSYSKLMNDLRTRKKVLSQEICKQISSKINILEYKRIQEEENERKDRLKALRECNMDAYVEMIKNVKNQRIQEILNNTERLLQDIGAKILVETSDNIEKYKKIDKKKLEKSAKNVKSKNKDENLDDESKDEKFEGAIKKENVEQQEDKQENTDQKNSSEEKKKYFTLCNRNSLKIKQPNCLIGGELMPYQLAGLEFLVNLYNNNLSSILADEMGLGKTIQTISLFAYLYESKRNLGPHLIIVPLSTLPNWAMEFKKWCPILKVLQYRGTKDERREMNAELHKLNFNVLLTTFEYVIREKRTLSRFVWKFIIVDEGHKMKNSKSKFHSTLGEFRSSNRLLLTGTPLQNNLNELWSLLNFLMPQTFNSCEDFEKWFEEPFREHYENKEDVSMTEEEKLVIINRLHLVLRPFLLRRVKADVLADLPSKIEYTIRICLSSYEEFLYDRLAKKCLKVKDAKGKVTSKSISNGIMQLRKAVNHPYLFLDQYNIDENLYRCSGKFETLDRMLVKLIHLKHKILIFTQMTTVIDILSDYLNFKDIKFFRLDGSMQMVDRQDRMNKFNQEDDDTFVFILSTRAGGLGLNLQAADTVILFDSDWNPHADLQAQARAHRVGQRNEVKVFRFITLSPVEELILSKAEYKLSMDEQIIQAGMFSSQFSEEEREEKLRNLLNHKVGKSTIRATTPEELCCYISRSEEEKDIFIKMDKEIFGEKVYSQFYDLDDAVDYQDNNSAITVLKNGDEKNLNTVGYYENNQTSQSVSNISLLTGIHDDQVKRDNEKIRELLEVSNRLISFSELPKDILDANKDYDETQKIKETVLGPRKSRLKAQETFKKVNEIDSYNEDMSVESPYKNLESNRSVQIKKRVSSLRDSSSDYKKKKR